MERAGFPPGMNAKSTRVRIIEPVGPDRNATISSIDVSVSLMIDY
jgi:hypothetical protein